MGEAMIEDKEMDEDLTKDEMLAMLIRIDGYFAKREAKLCRRFKIREELRALIDRAMQEV